MLQQIFIAADPAISLLRLFAFFCLLLLVWTVLTHEARDLISEGRSWVFREAERSRLLPGYVAALLGRNSALLAASTLVFGVFRGPYFETAAAKSAASLFSALAIIIGAFLGLLLLAITSEILSQSRGDKK